MFDRGKEFVLKVEERRLFFNERDFLPVEQVFLDHPDERGMAIGSFAFRQFPWIKIWVQKLSGGVLDCDVSDFNPSPVGFSAQVADLSKVREMSVFVEGDKVLEFARSNPKPVVREPPPLSPPVPEAFDEEVCF